MASETNDKSRAFVGIRRKDGKYPVQFVFPISGTRCNKLLSIEQVRELSGKYLVIGFTTQAQHRPASPTPEKERRE